jgi:hypothetical protein
LLLNSGRSARICATLPSGAEILDIFVTAGILTAQLLGSRTAVWFRRVSLSSSQSWIRITTKIFTTLTTIGIACLFEIALAAARAALACIGWVLTTAMTSWASITTAEVFVGSSLLQRFPGINELMLIVAY